MQNAQRERDAKLRTAPCGEPPRAYGEPPRACGVREGSMRIGGGVLRRGLELGRMGLVMREINRQRKSRRKVDRCGKAEVG